MTTNPSYVSLRITKYDPRMQSKEYCQAQNVATPCSTLQSYFFWRSSKKKRERENIYNHGIIHGILTQLPRTFYLLLWVLAFSLVKCQVKPGHLRSVLVFTAGNCAILPLLIVDIQSLSSSWIFHSKSWIYVTIFVLLWS